MHNTDRYPHLLFAHATLAYGGGERVLIEQVAALAELPIRISIAYRYDPEHRDIEAELRARNSNIAEVVYLPTQWACLKWLLRNRPDGVVAYGHLRMLRLLRQLARMGWKIPLMVTLHEHYLSHLRPYQRIGNLAQRWVITYDFQENVRKHLGPQPCHIMHPLYPRPAVLPFDAQARNLARKRLGIPDNALVLGYLGRQDTNKEPWQVVRFAEHLQTHMDQPVGVILAGRERSGATEQIDATLAASPLRERVLRLGKFQQFGEIAAALDLFVMTSYQEGYFPIALIEAMERGIPVAATTVGGIPTILHDGEDGFLIQKLDDQQSVSDQSLADAALRVSIAWRDTAGWQELRERTMQRVHALVLNYNASTPFQEAVQALLGLENGRPT